jgi:hypothetical protein
MRDRHPFDVRDLRSKEKFFVDDAYYNGYARITGWAAALVYFALCRHADKTQESFPSLDSIAEHYGISRRTTVNAIQRLQLHHIIVKSRTKNAKGQWLRNTYVLLDKKHWLTEPCASGACGLHVHVVPRPGARSDQDQVHVLHAKETHRKGTHRRNEKALQELRSRLESQGILPAH